MKILLLISVIALIVTAGGAAGATTSRSGLRGMALIDPASPVCNPGTSCTRPAAHAVLRFWRSGQLVAHTRANAKGRFRIALRPRTYIVTTTGTARLTPARVTVATGTYRRVTFRIDTGIR